MIPLHLAQLEKKLRDAARCRRYREVTQSATEFAEAVRVYAQDLPKGDLSAAQAGRQLGEALSWSLVMMQAARANCLAELRRVAAANRYARTYGETGRTAIHLDA